MKKIISILSVLTLLCLCGCGSGNDANPLGATPPLTSAETRTDSTITEDFESQSQGTTVHSYDPKDYKNPKRRTSQNSMSVNHHAKTVDEVLENIQDQGLIASGFAYGNRTSVEESLYYATKTQFKIDHVFYGNASPEDTITINESYLLKVDENGEPYIRCISENHSYLQNNEYVLVILKPSFKNDGAYATVHKALPVSEDCNEWSEEYLDSLLDYFRGDTSTYRIPTDTVYMYNGYPVLETAPDWPQRDISNEALIEEMQDNLLIYLATELKIKIWPTEHINYNGNHTGSSINSMIKWQYPKEQAEAKLR